MVPIVFEWEIILYEVIQVLVAFAAVVLAFTWKRSEFLAGLSFLLIYTILDLVDVSLSATMEGVYMDTAQFGFVLLSIICFIIGMHHSWALAEVSSHSQPETKDKSSCSTSIFSMLRKI
ncbi:MAG: hypothetical protein WCP36_06455 [Methanomicrobiales archaeon]